MHLLSLRVIGPPAEPHGLLGLLQESAPLSQCPVGLRRLILRGTLRAEIGQDQTAQQHAVEVEGADGEQDRHGHATRPGQLYLAASALAVPDLIDTYAAPFGSIGVAVALGFWLLAIAYLWVAGAVVTAVLAEQQR